MLSPTYFSNDSVHEEKGETDMQSNGGMLKDRETKTERKRGTDNWRDDGKTVAQRGLKICCLSLSVRMDFRENTHSRSHPQILRIRISGIGTQESAFKESSSEW